MLVTLIDPVLLAPLEAVWPFLPGVAGMARHFADSVATTATFFMARRLFDTQAEFEQAKIDRSTDHLDVRERMIAAVWSTSRGSFVCTTQDSVRPVVEVAEYDLDTTFILPTCALPLHGSKFKTFSTYATFFDAFPTIRSFKASFLATITLRFPEVSDYVLRMSTESDNAHLLERIATLLVRERDMRLELDACRTLCEALEARCALAEQPATH